MVEKMIPKNIAEPIDKSSVNYNWGSVYIIRSGSFLNKPYDMGIDVHGHFFIRIAQKEWTGGVEIFETIKNQFIWKTDKINWKSNELNFVFYPIYRIIGNYLETLMFYYLKQGSDGYRS
jgi:hypothetical protein